MKKVLLLLTVVIVLALSAVCVSASDSLEDYTPAKDKYTIIYNVGEDNAAGMYGMIAIKGTNTIINTSNLENIYYIDQTSADNEGNISFIDFAPKGVAPSNDKFEECTVFIGGPGFDTAEAIGYLKKGEAGYYISGKVVDSVNPGKTATITVKDSSGETIATATTAADGTFSIAVPAGENYIVVITKANYLSYTFTGINVLESAEAPIDLPDADISTSAGDINGTGEVNLDDLSFLLADYGEPVLLNPNSDINGTGEVNLDDLSILLASYGEKPIVIPVQ